MAAIVAETAAAAVEVAQTPKQAVSLATRSRSLPSQQAETQEPASLVFRPAAPPPCRAAALVRQFLAVRQPAASAIAQAGGVVSLSNPIIPGQSFSVVSGSGFGPLTVANGSMGAGYYGMKRCPSLTYQQSVSFTQNGGAFVLDLLSSDALGSGFDSALFQISLNSVVIDTQSFTDLASAEAFFSNNLIGVPLLAGPNSVQIAFSETMSSTEGFSFDYAVASSGSERFPAPSPVLDCPA